MSDTKNVVFRNAIGGYNKSDVNEYIIRCSTELMEREAAANERVKRAEEDSKEYLEKLRLSEEELEKARTEIEKKDAEIESILAEKQLLEDKISLEAKFGAGDTSDKSSDGDEKAEKLEFEKQEAIIAGQYEEIEALKAQLERFSEQGFEPDITKEKYEELIKKAALYDKTSASIGEALLSANKTAEEVILAAREEARILKEKAERELLEKRKNIEETSKRAMESIFAKLSLAAAESRRDVTAVTSYTYSVLEKAIEDIKVKSSNSAIKIKSYEDSIWRGVKDDLNSISTSTHVPDQKKHLSEQMKRFKK